VLTFLIEMGQAVRCRAIGCGVAIAKLEVSLRTRPCFRAALFQLGLPSSAWFGRACSGTISTKIAERAGEV